MTKGETEKKPTCLFCSIWLLHLTDYAVSSVPFCVSSPDLHEAALGRCWFVCFLFRGYFHKFAAFDWLVFFRDNLFASSCIILSFFIKLHCFFPPSMVVTFVSVLWQHTPPNPPTCALHTHTLL